MSAFCELIAPEAPAAKAFVDTVAPPKDVDEDELYAIIGAQASSAAGERVTAFILDRKALIDIGKVAFRNLEKAVHRLICQDDAKDKDTKTAIETIIGAITTGAIGRLALALAGVFALPQLVATAVATLLIKLLAEATVKTICDVWKPA